MTGSSGANPSASRDSVDSIPAAARASPIQVSGCRALSEDEHRQVKALLERVAEQQGLGRGIHPGFRRLRPGRKPG